MNDVKEVKVTVNSEWNKPTTLNKLIYYAVALLVAMLINIDVSLWINIGAYILTTYVLAPHLAQLIVTKSANAFIDNEIHPCPKEPTGEKEFELYHQKVTVKWISTK